MLHQYQRQVKTINHNGQVVEYIEVTKEDILIANQLAHDILGRTLDELPPQTRRLLDQVHRLVTDQCRPQQIEQSDYRFSRKDIRQYVGWTDFQVKKHMQRLQDLEYVLVHRGRRGQSFEYELLYQGEGQGGDGFLMGLANLNHDYDGQQRAPQIQRKRP